MTDRKTRRLLCAALCLILCCTLTGCIGGVDALNHDSGVTLPPAATSHVAPTGDTNQETAQTVLSP